MKSQLCFKSLPNPPNYPSNPCHLGSVGRCPIFPGDCQAPHPWSVPLISSLQRHSQFVTSPDSFHSLYLYPLCPPWRLSLGWPINCFFLLAFLGHGQPAIVLAFLACGHRLWDPSHRQTNWEKSWFCIWCDSLSTCQRGILRCWLR